MMNTQRKSGDFRQMHTRRTTCSARGTRDFPKRGMQAAALVALSAAPAVFAEPYSGGPADDPLVRFVSWTILVATCLVLAFMFGTIASRARFRTRRFAIVFPASFLGWLFLSLLAGALGTIEQLASLFLHLIF